MPSPTLSSKDVTRFFLLFVFLFGGIVRIFPFLITTGPLMDGGMFQVMIRDLQAAHFTLPAFTTYNHSNIPFTYPPLGFYIAGGLNSLFGISISSLLTWQPLITNLLSLPVFFLLAKQLLRDENKAALATLIFSLTPNSYWWQIVGGGLTRSLGAFFFLLTALSADNAFRTRKPTWVIATALTGSLAALSHPEWALQTVATILLFWFFHGRDRQGLILLATIGVTMIALTMPWWLTVAHQHGLTIFLQASQATKSRWLFWTIPFTMGFTGEFTPVIAVLAVCGLFLHLAKKDYLLPAWTFLILFVDPRGGMPASVIPFALMANTLLTDAIAPLLAASPSDAKPAWTASLQSTTGRVFWSVLLLIFLYGAFRVSLTLSQQSLDDEMRQSFAWVEQNTAPTDRFLLLDWQDNPLLSTQQEWFPALADRQSITTIQGSEWLTGENGFTARTELNKTVHACIFEETSCLDVLNGQYDFILLSIKTSNTTNRNYPLLFSLQTSPDVSLVYSTPGIWIFRVQK